MTDCLYIVYFLCRMTLHQCKIMFGGWLGAYKQWKEVPLNPPNNLTAQLQQEIPACLSMGMHVCLCVCAHASVYLILDLLRQP